MGDVVEMLLIVNWIGLVLVVVKVIEMKLFFVIVLISVVNRFCVVVIG